MLHFVILLICYIEERIITLAFTKSLTATPAATISKRCLLAVPAYAALGSCIEYFFDGMIWASLITVLLDFLFLITIYRLSFSETVMLSMINYVGVFVLQLPIMLLISLFTTDVSNPLIGILGNLLTLLLVLLLCRWYSFSKLYEQIISKSRILCIAITNLFGIFMIIKTFYEMQPDNFYQNMLVVSISISVLILVNWLLIIEQKNNIERKQELESYKKHLPIIEELINQVRKRQHAYDNQIIAMQALPHSYKDYESLSDAITNYSTYIATGLQESLLLKLNLKLVAGFLFSKIQLALQDDKHLNIVVRNQVVQTTIPEYELIDVLGILIDNMLDAIPPEGDAQLIIDSHNQKIEIATINLGPKITLELQRNLFTKGFSTKQNASGTHGHGLCILQDIVNKYDGTIKITNESEPVSGETLIRFDVVI